MREINNNADISKVQKTDLKVDKVSDSEIEKISSNEVKDFSNPHAEALGRSQISKVDSLKHDVDFGMAHPDSIASADKFFDMAYAQLLQDNGPDAYAKAASMTKTYVDEFSKR